MKILKNEYYPNMWLDKILAYIYIILKDSYNKKKYLEYRKVYSIDPTFKFRGSGIILFGEGRIVLNENSYIGRNSILESIENSKIIVGRNCAIGPYVKMYTHGKATDQNLDQNPFGKRVKYSNGDIIIGNGCWIGSNVGITHGIKIGDNSVIGMNSVVTKDIPPNSIAVGSPAKVVRFKSYCQEK